MGACKSHPVNSKSCTVDGGDPIDFLETEVGRLEDVDELISRSSLPPGPPDQTPLPSIYHGAETLPLGVPLGVPDGRSTRQPSSPSSPRWPMQVRLQNVVISGGFLCMASSHQPLLLEVLRFLLTEPNDFRTMCLLSPALAPFMEPFMDCLWSGLYRLRWPAFHDLLSHFNAEAWLGLYWQTWRGNSQFPIEVFDREKRLGFCMSAMPALVWYDCTVDGYVVSYISASQVKPEVIPKSEERRLRACPALARQRLRVHQLQDAKAPLQFPQTSKRNGTYPFKVLDGLDGLEVGQAVELQWKMQLGSPFGWWFGHLEALSFDAGCETACATVIFKHFSTRSRWHRLRVRVGGREVRRCDFGGFTGGLRPVAPAEEAVWQSFLPPRIMDI
mmetsp:Transcript_9545/g.23016  ORF Transcript_9545/g.23016 Transcript_9545/m.23016 type:complete len:387 (+) Transcript_9545:51-1211(+)